MQSGALLIVFNMIILESLLSVDNAAVLAIMVKDLPGRQKKQALRYGLWGAYLLRGSCLFVAAWLVKIIWLKIAGGGYLLHLVYGHFTKDDNTIEETTDKKESKIFRAASKIGLSQFWATVCLVEIMDLAFSIDNIFAAVALSNKIYLIMIGVAIGILAMRIVAGWFVSLINQYPSLENSAFIVIGLLGLKLIISGIADYSVPFAALKVILSSHVFDLCFSAVMMLIFFLPLIGKKRATP